MVSTFRKATHLLIYYLLPLVLLIMSFVDPRRHFFVKLGDFALYALIAVMFIKPLYVLIPWKFLRRIGTFRRELGLLSFWLFFFHAAGVIYTSNLFGNLNKFLDVGGYLFWGAIAGICMVVLGVTSNNFSTRILGGNWKRVHYLAYVAFIAVLVHSGLVNKGENFTLNMIVAGIYVVLKGAEFWKMRVDALREAEGDGT